MRRPLTALTIALGAALPVATLAQHPPAQDESARELRRFLDGLLSRDRRTFKIGQLDVQVSAVPDYFMVMAAREALRVEGRSPERLKADLQRLADRNRKLIGKVGIRVRLLHGDRGDRNFYAFDGRLDDHIRVHAAGNVAATVVAHEGSFEQVELTLFRASLSPVFAAQGNCPPTMRRRVSRLGDQPFWVELVPKRDLNPRAEKLQVGVGGFMHFSGRGISGNQVDFDNGAACVIEPSEPVEFALPLPAHPVPPALAEVMPTIPD